MDKQETGTVEIGYIYTLIISALVLASLTVVVSDRMEQMANSSTAFQLQEVGQEISMRLNRAQDLLSRHSGASFTQTITIPSQINNNIYSISIYESRIYLNSSFNDIHREYELTNSYINVYSFNQVSREISRITSNSGRIQIVYNPQVSCQKILVLAG